MKKILIGIVVLVITSCKNHQQPSYRCQWCNDTLCVTGWCGCDNAQNCQTEVITCDFLLQVDSAYYRARLL